MLYCNLHLTEWVCSQKCLGVQCIINSDPRLYYETVHELLTMCCVKTWQKSKLPHFFHYIFELSCYVHFLYIFFLKIFHNHRKSLGEYFTSPFRYMYSIYIHSWAHIWHPFRKAFSSDCMEGMPTYKTHTSSIQVLRTEHSKGLSITVRSSKSNI